MYPTQTVVSRNLKYQCRHQAGSENQYCTITKQWAAFPNVLELQTYMYYFWDLKLQTHTAAAFNTPHVPFFQNVKATDYHFTAKTEQSGQATSLFWKKSRGSHSLWSTITFLLWKHSRRLQKYPRLTRAGSILFNSISTCKCRTVLNIEISFTGVAICCTLLTSFLLIIVQFVLGTM